jgi:hypothetical protein
VKEEGFLKMLSELVGQYRYTSVSTSRQKDSRSTSRQDSTNDILSVADLAAMPKGLAIMLGSGSRVVLLRMVRISDHPYANKVAAFEAVRSAPPAAIEPVGTPRQQVRRGPKSCTSVPARVVIRSVHASARKYGVSENHAPHAVMNKVYEGYLDDGNPARRPIVGFNPEGALLELVVLIFDSGNERSVQTQRLGIVTVAQLSELPANRA